MPKLPSAKSLIPLTLAAAVAVAVPLVPAAQEGSVGAVGVSADGYVVDGVTKPEADPQLALPMRGRIGEVLVSKGDRVSAGDVLVKLEDTQQQIAVKKAKMEAEQRAPAIVELREKELEKAKVDLKRLTDANADRPGTYNETEIREAELAVEQADAQLKVAKIEVDAAVSEVEAQEATLELMHVVAPTDGVIRDVLVEVGEVVDEQRPAVVMVGDEVLKISVMDLNSAQVATLSVGQEVPVRYAREEMQGDEWQTAVITWIDPVIDASKIHLIELEISNDRGTQAGRDVEVLLPAELAEYAEMRRGRRLGR